MDDFALERVQKLREIKAKILQGAGPEKIAKLHERGKLTARERINRLLDPGSFVEMWPMIGHLREEYGDALICGSGTVDGRPISIYSQDSTIAGGSIGGAHGFKMYKMIEWAMNMRMPLVGLHDSPGARNPRLTGGGEGGGEEGGAGGGEKHPGTVFFPNTQASGVVPQISGILGNCAGIAVYSPALTDFIFMVDGISQMYITGPRIVKVTMDEDISGEDLGGARVHSRESGVCDFRYKSEDECFQSIKKLLSFLPSSCEEKPPVVNTGDDPDRYDEEIGDIVPSHPYKAFDVRKVIRRLVDKGDFLEVKPEFAGEIVVGFGRLDGRTVGFVANQCMVRAGSLTVDSSCKQARFIRFCDCFNIPLVMLVDTPAYQPGSQQEHMGIIRHGAKVLYALCEATVPRVAVVLRKTYGGGNLGMGVYTGLATDMIYYWPIMEFGIMGAEQSVELFFAQDIMKAPDPVKAKEEKVKEYRERFANPLRMISRSTDVQEVIEPRETRRRLIQVMKFLQNKKVERYPKRHGNIPL